MGYDSLKAAKDDQHHSNSERGIDQTCHFYIYCPAFSTNPVGMCSSDSKMSLVF